MMTHLETNSKSQHFFAKFTKLIYMTEFSSHIEYVGSLKKSGESIVSYIDHNPLEGLEDLLGIKNPEIRDQFADGGYQELVEWIINKYPEHITSLVERWSDQILEFYKEYKSVDFTKENGPTHFFKELKTLFEESEENFRKVKKFINFY